MVKMCDSATVFPSKAVQKHIIKLSICDVYSPKVWVTQTHFWPLEDDSLFDKAYESLKHGLGRTLSEVPALAGRIGRISDDPRDLVIFVDETAHVELPSDDLTSNPEVASYAEIKEAGFPMTSLAIPFSAQITLSPVFEGAPMLACKLNKLRGGMALSFGFNHLFADASTVAETERIWSLHTADVSAGLPQQVHKGSGDDEPSRARLSTPAPGTSSKFEDEHWKVFPTNLSQLGLPSQPVSAEAALTMLHKAKEQHWAALSGEIDLPKWCIWHFSPASLAQLKKDCSSGLEAGEWTSTMDALVGLFWSRISWLKKATRGEQERSELCFPINIRTRIDPPLHPQYMGNAVDILAATASLAELEDASVKGWAAAARAVRKAVTSWKQEGWESWLAMAKELAKEEAICPNPLMLLDQRNIAYNDYSRSQSNTLNWGKDFGVPDRTRYMKPAGTMKGCATGVVVHPRMADGGLEIATTTTDALRDALAEDEVFKRYAKLTCAFA